jgi:hypothetical protein
MRDRIAGPRWWGKPLQIAVDSVTGTTEAAPAPRRPVSTARLAAAPIRPETMLDNAFSAENYVCLRAASLAEPGKDGTAAHNPEQCFQLIGSRRHG